MIDLRAEPADVGAAAMALLALATIVGHESLHALPAVELDGAVLEGPLDAVTASLARAAKPMFCRTLGSRAAPVFTFAALLGQARDVQLDAALAMADISINAERERPAGSPPVETVLCVGSAEKLLVGVDARARFEKDYVVVLGGLTADKVGSAWADGQGLSRAAREVGAEYVVRFSSPVADLGIAFDFGAEEA